MTQLFLIFLP